MLMPMPLLQTRTPKSAFPGNQLAADRLGEVGIINRLVRKRAEVRDDHPLFRKMIVHGLLHLDSAVIGGDREPERSRGAHWLGDGSGLRCGHGCVLVEVSEDA